MVSLHALIFVVLVHAVSAAASAAEVDPRLVGTWELQGSPSAIYWVVRADGFYRLHSRHKNVSHRGSFSADGTVWSLNSPQWQDGGNYQLVDEDTWSASGVLGTGIWRRVWRDGMPLNDIGARQIEGACELIAPAEVSVLLNAPVSAVEGIGSRLGERHRGCRFQSGFARSDVLDIYVYPTNTTSRRSVLFTSRAVSVPALGPAARAEASRGGMLSMEAELGGHIYVVNLRLEPVADGSDLDALTRVVQTAASRNALR